MNGNFVVHLAFLRDGGKSEMAGTLAGYGFISLSRFFFGFIYKNPLPTHYLFLLTNSK